jgi:nucleotide-binding universal stress UspA family protein
MFRNIVAAYNGSQESKRALQSAVLLAKVTGATLHEITVLKDPPAYADSVYTTFATVADPSFPVVLKGDLHNVYEQLQDDARQIARKGGMDVATHLIEGDDVASIIKFVSEIGADLLVIGIHKRQLHLSSIWSTAHDLAQQAPCSILGVP